MKLTYRGADYNHQNPSIPKSSNFQLAKYRGHIYSIPQNLAMPNQQLFLLKYRGIEYQSSSLL